MEKIRFPLFLILAGSVGLSVSWMILQYSIPSFDGAFNTQAAFNFFQGNGLVLDYGEKWTLQTGLPFQFLNGAFLILLGRHFTAAAMGNLVFYWAFFLFSLLLARNCRTVLPLLAFMAVSLMPPFRIYAFEGYGELPALTFMLFGGFIIIHGRSSVLRCAAGWMLAALAIATKLVLALALLPLMILSLVIWIKEKRKSVLYGWFIFLSVLATCLLIQYAPYEADEMQTLSASVLTHGASTVEKKIVHVFFNRMRVFLEYYMDETRSNLLAGAKLILFIFVGSCTLFFFLRRVFPASVSLSSREYTFLFLGTLCTAYMVWHMFLGMKPWYRMAMNADILLFYSLALLPAIGPGDCERKKLRFFFLSLLCLLLLINLALTISMKKPKYPASIFENSLREGLNRLPPVYTGFGYGWWQAPRWSFLAQRPFHNLYRQSALYRHFSDGIQSFLFLEDVNRLEKKTLKEIENQYDMEEVFSWHGFNIARIVGLSKNEKRFVQEIDFEKESFSDSVEGFFFRKNEPLRYTMPDAAVFLDNGQGKPAVAMQFYVHGMQAGKVLRAVAVPAAGPPAGFYDIPLEKGFKRITLVLPQNVRDKFILYLLVETGFRREGAQKSAGIGVLKISLTDQYDIQHAYVAQDGG